MIQEMTCRMMAESDIDLVVPLYIEHYNTYEGGEVIGFVMGYFEQYDDIHDPARSCQ